VEGLGSDGICDTVGDGLGVLTVKLVDNRKEPTGNCVPLLTT